MIWCLFGNKIIKELVILHDKYSFCISCIIADSSQEQMLFYETKMIKIDINDLITPTLYLHSKAHPRLAFTL